MPLGGYLLIGLLGLLLTLTSVLQYVKGRNANQCGLQLLCIAVYFAAILHFFGLPSAAVEPKGPDEGQRFWAAVAVVYLCIVLGMLAEAFYSWLDKPRRDRQRTGDWGAIVKPLFVSPLVLIPMVAAFQNANIDLTKLGFPWLMILLTAFEKGFLWRHYLAKRSAELGSPGAKRRGAET